MSDEQQSPEQKTDGMSRRGFMGAATAAAAGLIVAPAARWASPTYAYAQTSGPNSTIAGVNIGTITYSYRSMPGGNDPIQLLGYLVASGISHTELMGGPIMAYLGAPTVPGGGGGGGQNAANQDPAAQADLQRRRAAAQAELNRWYASPPMEKLAALRKLYNDEGVSIHIAKFSPGTSVEASEFAFKAARALGAQGVTTELGEEPPKVQGPIALKYGQKAAFHTHLQPGEPNFPGYDHFLAMSPGVHLNLDTGHYYAATGRSPVPEIKRLHDRILSIHLKDRTSPEEGQDNVMWGRGGTPIPDILRTLYREKYPIFADIELEYDVPQGSDAVTEVKRCLELCRDVLTRVSTPRPTRAAPAGAAPGGNAPTRAPGTAAPTTAPRP
jgi:sugar phosphate isomerase/epimerase